jgi:hypothetical protein
MVLKTAIINFIGILLFLAPVTSGLKFQPTYCTRMIFEGFVTDVSLLGQCRGLIGICVWGRWMATPGGALR